MVKTYPRPTVDVAFMPAMDEYVKPFIEGLATPDKPYKELQDKVLDVVGPPCTVFEHLANMGSSIPTEGFLPGANKGSPIQPQREHNIQHGCWELRLQLIPKISNPLTIQATASMKSTWPDFLSMFLDFFQHSIPQDLPRTSHLKLFLSACNGMTEDPWVLEVIQAVVL